ncbi:hypothetical protein [Lachnoclostridium sp. An138]|uniref:hypothetical protein n=1 Tax=Lachnoclostridium sp. An138 TaxID=1965560 RepID=UPI000B39C6D7|nr:hypothetical protein [Lachnoclostridium sp. An138]OUQ14920.1 hypothetical protein B5E82_16530 [Lachnoclostridium sp. An138]
MADGTVLIDTEIDTDGMKAGGREVEAACRRMAVSVNDIGTKAKIALDKQVNAFIKLNQEYEAQKKKVDELTQKVEAYGEQEVPTEEYAEIQKQISQAEQQMMKLIDAQDRFIATGGKEDSSAYKRRQYDIEELANTIKYAEAELKKLEAAGKAFTSGMETKEYAADMERLVAAKKRLSDMNNRLGTSYSSIKAQSAEYGANVNKIISDVTRGTQYTGFFQSALNGLKMAAHAPISIFQQLGQTLRNLPMNAVRASVNVARTAFVKFGTAVKSALSNLAQFTGKKILAGLKKISSGIFGINKSANKTSMGLGGMLKNGLLMGLAFRAFSGILTSVKEGFQNLAKYSSTTNKGLSMLKSSLTQLKNSFATAFAPILNVIAPILSKFINMLSAAATAVGRLFAALTGQKTFTKAVAVQEDYAASLEDSASGAKDAEKAMEGYLSPLDEINKLETKDNSDSGGYTDPSPSEMFETVEVEPLSFDSWGEAFSAFLDYLLHTGIPDLRNALSGIAKTVNTFSANLYEMFSFPGVADKVRLLGQEISNAFNDFVDWIDWEMMGAALGSGLNLAFQFLVNLVYTFDWQNLGASIATMLNRALSEVDWHAFGQLLWSRFKIAIETLAGFLTNLDMSQVANALSQSLIGVLDSITGTLNSVNWKKLGNQIATLIAEIDYSGIATSLFRGLGAALASLAEFLWGLIELAWNSVVTWWRNTAFKDGQFTMQGLLEGILEIFKNIGSWIKTHIFQPFIDGFKSAFGVNSPSIIMRQMGIYLIEGLFNGVESLKEKLINAFVNIKDRIVSVWEMLKSRTEAIWNGIKNFIRPAVNGIIGFINGLIDGITSGVNTVIRALNRIRFNVDIPLFGNFKFDGFNLSTLSAPSIPYLASGAVIPPNAPFMAVLGDQRNGNNLEMPESLLRRIIREESGKGGGNETIKIPVILDGRQVFEAVINRGKRAQSANGRNPFELA